MRGTDASHEGPLALVLESTLVRTRRADGGPDGQPGQLRLAHHGNSSTSFATDVAVTQCGGVRDGSPNDFPRSPHTATVPTMSDQPNVEYGERGVALPNEILRSVVGSGLHGIAIEGTDDHDEMGVYIEPPEWVLGVERHREGLRLAETTGGSSQRSRRHRSGALLAEEVPPPGDQGQSHRHAAALRPPRRPSS